YNKAKLNIRVTIKDKYNRKKQIRALMPNLIYSLDRSSLSLLTIKFFKLYKVAQFYTVYNCFRTTIDKVESSKVLRASIYTEIYLDSKYLERFDKSILDSVENAIGNILDRKKKERLL
ncbi:uncharacterized protein MYCFIDRAFT_44213, partial [Pseudocercospora fijiensis CIRAD86]